MFEGEIYGRVRRTVRVEGQSQRPDQVHGGPGGTIRVWTAHLREQGKFMRSLVLALALAGVAVSCLSLQAHYSNDSGPAISKSHWNSNLVNHSPYSAVAGIPIAAFGVVGYAAVGLLAFFRRRAPTAVFALFGLAYALYLTKIEAHILKVWCVYCVASLIIVVLITLLAFGELIFPATQARVISAG